MSRTRTVSPLDPDSRRSAVPSPPLRTSRQGSTGGHENRVRATELFDQQLWCLGTDIRYPGNLLLRHGFVRIPPSTDQKCSSAYRLDLPQGGHILLRGFGVFYGEPGVGGAFIGRQDFRPLLTPGADLPGIPWWPEGLPPLRVPSPAEVRAWHYLTQVLVGWLQVYESWVLDVAGPDHRLAGVEFWSRKRRPVVPGTAMRWAWSWVRKQLQTHPEQFWCDASDHD